MSLHTGRCLSSSYDFQYLNLKPVRRHLTTADMVLVAVSACLIVASFFVVGAADIRGNEVLIQVDGRVVHKTSLNDTHRTVVRGTRGSLTVETREGKVAIIEADCPNHVCMKIGWQSHAGEVIVCVPNKTVVRILGEQKGVRATTG